LTQGTPELSTRHFIANEAFESDDEVEITALHTDKITYQPKEPIFQGHLGYKADFA
jgi:hypothetical protein